MGDFFLELIVGMIQEGVPSFIKFIGALIRWTFYLGRKNLRTVLKEDWNKRVGFISIVIIIVVIINLSY